MIVDPDATRILEVVPEVVAPPDPVTRLHAARRIRRAWWWAVLATLAVFGLYAGWLAQTAAAGGCG